MAEELHAIGLAFETPDDLRRFYPLVVRALHDPSIGPNEWLRAVRNICRFRNHALHPDAIYEPDLYQLTERIFETLQKQEKREEISLNLKFSGIAWRRSRSSSSAGVTILSS